MAEEKIVEGVAAMVNTSAFGVEKSTLAKDVEAAMAAAVSFAYSEGITDPDKIRELMLLARDEVVAGNLTR